MRLSWRIATAPVSFINWLLYQWLFAIKKLLIFVPQNCWSWKCVRPFLVFTFFDKPHSFWYFPSHRRGTFLFLWSLDLNLDRFLFHFEHLRRQDLLPVVLFIIVALSFFSIGLQRRWLITNLSILWNFTKSASTPIAGAISITFMRRTCWLTTDSRTNMLRHMPWCLTSTASTWVARTFRTTVMEFAWWNAAVLPADMTFSSD